jgi:hypothetical protein
VRDLGVGLAKVRVPGCMAVADANCAVHAADGDDGAGFEGVGVLAEGRGCDGRRGCEFGSCLWLFGDWDCG